MAWLAGSSVIIACWAHHDLNFSNLLPLSWCRTLKDISILDFGLGGKKKFITWVVMNFKLCSLPPPPSN